MAARLIIEAASNCAPPFPAGDAAEKVVRAYTKYPDGSAVPAVPAGDAGEMLMQLDGKVRHDAALRFNSGEGSGLGSLGSRRDMAEMSGADLVALAGTERRDPPSLPFLGQNGYIIEKWSHLLAGYPRCGKSELLVRLCGEWVEAGKRIVYFTEEPQSIWEYRLPKVGGNWEGLQVAFALGAPLEEIFRRAFGGEEDIVVIDTMRNLLRLEDEKDNSGIAAALNPWVAEARAHDKTLIISHHMRKGAGDHGEGIAGGHALLGVFDIALELKRDEHKKTRRKVEAFARLISPPEMIYELEEDGTMRSLGDPSALQLADVVERVRGVVGDEWEKTSDLWQGMGEDRPSMPQVRVALKHLADQREIERDPALSEGNAAGRTVRWRRKQ